MHSCSSTITAVSHGCVESEEPRLCCNCILRDFLINLIRPVLFIQRGLTECKLTYQHLMLFASRMATFILESSETRWHQYRHLNWSLKAFTDMSFLICVCVCVNNLVRAHFLSPLIDQGLLFSLHWLKARQSNRIFTVNKPYIFFF